MSNIHFELFKFMNEHGDKTQNVRKSVMPDREKVIKALECCLKESDHLYSNPCNSCPYEGKECIDRMKTDALSLLKEQEPPTSDELKVHYGKMYKCKGCGLEWYQQAQRYCQHCGRSVKLK